MRAFSKFLVSVLPAAALLAAFAGGALAGPRWPDLAIGLGTTAAVSSEPDGGGFAAWGAALWPVDERFAFGIQAFADDMGNDLVQVYTGDTPPVALGTVERRHRFTWGAGWRFDASLPGAGMWEPTASVTWSGVRIQDDARGTVLGALTSNGLGIGLGIRRPVLRSSTVGLAVRYHHLFNDLVDGYVSAGVEFGWRFGKDLGAAAANAAGTR